MNELSGRDGEAVGRFVAEALAVMNAYRRQVPYQPCWATGWTALREVLTAGPERWLEVLGVPKAGAPRWLIVLQYRVREAMPVVRPTQLDAGWRPYHFPSPPAAPWGECRLFWSAMHFEEGGFFGVPCTLKRETADLHPFAF